MKILETTFTNQSTDALERHGTLDITQDDRRINVELHHSKPITIDGETFDMPVGTSFIRLTKRSEGFEVVSIHVDNHFRGKISIVLNLIRLARELANEPVCLSSMRSPHGKRLGTAMEKLGWTYTDENGKEWLY